MPKYLMISLRHGRDKEPDVVDVDGELDAAVSVWRAANPQYNDRAIVVKMAKSDDIDQARQEAVDWHVQLTAQNLPEKNSKKLH